MFHTCPNAVHNALALCDLLQMMLLVRSDLLCAQQIQNNETTAFAERCNSTSDAWFDEHGNNNKHHSSFFKNDDYHKNDFHALKFLYDCMLSASGDRSFRHAA